MAALAIGFSTFVSLPSSSLKFPTKVVDTVKIKSVYAGNIPWKSQECPNGDFSPVKFPVYEGKVEGIRQLLKSKIAEEDPIGRLVLVDAIQRLGVAHRYREDIRTTLDYHYMKNGDSIHGCNSLHDVALSFRLLRQWGYQVSADEFNNFKDKNGTFEGRIRHDIRGLLELYEATQLSFEGENILDEAEYFSNRFLRESMASDSKWHNIVNTRLRHPYHKSITRLSGNNLLGDVQGMIAWQRTLTELAELDFAIGQSVHRQELLQISKWWDDLGLSRELKLARNQPQKWYTWSMAILIDDISLSVQRVELTKAITFIYLIDDIFDLYGMPQELALFAEAVNKWDYAAMDTLPDYMKMCYKALLETTNEIGHMIYEKHGYNAINSLKQTWGSLCNAFLVEAKWFASKHLPRSDEYLANGTVSSGVHVVLVHLFFLLGLGGTSGGATHLDDTSTIISSVASILRLWDDLGSAKDEHQNGKDGSYIECYMNDHQGLAFEQAREHVAKMIASEWKRLNKECFHLSTKSSRLPFQEASLNLARMVSLMYSYDDNQRLPILDDYIQVMLLNDTFLNHHRTGQEELV